MVNSPLEMGDHPKLDVYAILGIYDVKKQQFYRFLSVSSVSGLLGCVNSVVTMSKFRAKP